jgi:hypothetical protein
MGKLVSEGKWVATDLVEPYFGSWRALTVDSFLTSVAQAEGLFKKRLTITDTVRSNK